MTNKEISPGIIIGAIVFVVIVAAVIGFVVFRQPSAADPRNIVAASQHSTALPTAPGASAVAIKARIMHGGLPDLQRAGPAGTAQAAKPMGASGAP